MDVRDGTAPDDLAIALGENPLADRRWPEMARSMRVQYVHWISIAKRPKTRARRITETVRLVERDARRKSSP